jgi:hypothetical protein
MEEGHAELKETQSAASACKTSAHGAGTCSRSRERSAWPDCNVWWNAPCAQALRLQRHTQEHEHAPRITQASYLSPSSLLFTSSAVDLKALAEQLCSSTSAHLDVRTKCLPGAHPPHYLTRPIPRQQLTGAFVPSSELDTAPTGWPLLPHHSRSCTASNDPIQKAASLRSHAETIWLQLSHTSQFVMRLACVLIFQNDW